MAIEIVKDYGPGGDEILKLFEEFEGGSIEIDADEIGAGELIRFPPWPAGVTHISLELFTLIKTLPPLPDGLKHLEIYDSYNLEVLPPLPEGLDTLTIESGGMLDTIPALPSTLTRLSLDSNKLKVLPPLPAGLDELAVTNNLIQELPTLPLSLSTLNVRLNPSLRSLPELVKLKALYCGNNNLTSLPELPDNLELLECSNGKLESLPTLPDSLTLLRCDNNRDLIGLPTLPPRLQTLDCSLCQLTELPELPERLEYLDCAENAFSVLPRLPARLMQLDAQSLPNLKKLTPPCPERLKLVRVSEIFGYTDIVPKPEVGELLGAYMNRLQGLPPPSEPMWTGYSKGDVELFKSFFVQAKRNNVSVCPVCLAYADRIEGCMFMTHKCDREARHENLYKLYSDDAGKIEWCTICGRVSENHTHFTLNLPDEKRPAFVQFRAQNMIDHFQEDCIPVGGGGFEEKFRRLEKLLNYACQLQDEVGKSPAKKIREELIEEVWKAALLKDRTVIKKFESGKFDFPCDFPDDGAPANAERVYPDIPVPDGVVPPVKHETPDNECLTELGEHDDHRPVYQFIHEKWSHEGEYICGPHLEAGLKTNVFKGLCPINPEKCQAKLYPMEIKDIVSPEYYEIYRKLFNKQFQVQVQVAGGASIMRKIDPAGIECPIMPKAGYRSTYRRKWKTALKRRTMRSNFKKVVQVRSKNGRGPAHKSTARRNRKSRNN